MKNAIQKAAATQMDAPKQSMNALINTMLDQNGLRRRFDELLGARAPQFISSIVSLVNADVNLAVPPLQPLKDLLVFRHAIHYANVIVVIFIAHQPAEAAS